MDEVAEYRRDALEGLRQPLEDGAVVIARTSGSVAFPAEFTLVAAANPCPCGFLGDLRERCTCMEHRVASYAARLSGPLLDRIDLHLQLPRLTPEELLAGDPGESSAVVRDRVEDGRARQRHRARAGGTFLSCNASIPGPRVREEARCTPDAEDLLSDAVDRLRLSGRGFDRVLRVARTIADLGASDRVGATHLSEALSYRRTGAREGGLRRAV